MHLTSRIIALLAAVTLLLQPARGKSAPPSGMAGTPVSLPRLFSDNMVLQQGVSVPIWGWGQEGEIVTVRFQNQSVSDPGQGWEMAGQIRELEARRSGHAHHHSGEHHQLTNVLVGEVWLASGQSNMEFPLKKSYAAEEDIASQRQSDDSFIESAQGPAGLADE